MGLHLSGSTTAQLNSAYATRWQANTAYTAGQRVVNPALQIVSAKADFTSGSSYDSTNWNAPSGLHRFESSVTGDHPLTVFADKADGKGMQERFTVENTPGGGGVDINMRNSDLNLGLYSLNEYPGFIKVFNPSGTTNDNFRIWQAGQSANGNLASKLTSLGQFVSYAKGLSSGGAFSLAAWGEANQIFRIGAADGKLNWGPGGATALDTFLYRDSAGVLRTDGSLKVGTATVTTQETAVPYGWKSGNYYTTVGITSNSTRSMTNGQAWAIPIIVPRSCTIDRIGAEVTTAGDAGATLRFGIFTAAADGTPGTLLLDGGTVGAASTGGKEVTVSQALTPGLYHIIVVGQGSTTAPVLRAAVGSAPGVGSTTLTSVTGGNLGGFNTAAASVAAGLPGTLTLSSSSTSAPTVAVRVV